MQDRHIAFGDIHGDIYKLKRVIDLISPSMKDTLIFLGDYIDRGYNSKEVIDYLIDLDSKYNCVFLKGNHEDMFLYAYCADYIPCFNYLSPLELCIYNGGDNTLTSYGVPNTERDQTWYKYIPESHKNFFNNLKTYYESEHYVCVHAAITNDIPEQTDPYICLWHKFSMPEEYTYKKDLIHGHKASKDSKIKTTFNHQTLQEIVCIDTGCGKGGCLTAYEIFTKEKWNSK